MKEILHGWCLGALFALGVLLVMMALLRDAGAHSWYPQECCSDKDCRPIEDPRLVTESGDSYVFDGLAFPKRSTKASPDGHYHICIRSVGFGQRWVLCMWRPFQGS